MLLITELSTRIRPPTLLAHQNGVWRFKFSGDRSFTDDTGSTWFWPIESGLEIIRGVTLGTVDYLELSSVAAVIATEESFYYDEAVKQLFVHHADNINDYALGNLEYRILSVSAGFATGRYPGQPSVYSNQYYDPVITSIGSLKKKVDPLKFGLLSFERSSYELANANGERDDFSDQEALNSQVRFFLMQEGQRNTADGLRIFTGYTGGASINDETLSVQLQEARQFYNRLICPTFFDTVTYPNIDDRWIGKPLPVAYGDVRRGIATPIDATSYDKATGGNITFKLADDSIHPIRQIDAVYDENGTEYTSFVSTDLTACTVTVNFVADSGNINKCTWRGQGYELTTGTYTNGLDIIRDVFSEQGKLPYGIDTFDVPQWDAQTVANPQPVGISIQSDKGLIEELVEPITVSLQGIVDVLGDGRITFRPRDPLAPISRAIYQYDILEGPTFDLKTDEVVSSVVVTYSPNFVDDEDTLQAIYDGQLSQVVTAYAVRNTKPISPVPTVLTVEEDARAVGEEVASTSSAPQELVPITIPLDTEQIQLFDIIQVDVGRPQREDWRVYEVLERTLSLLRGDLVIELFLRRLPDRAPDFELITSFDEGLFTQTATDTFDEGDFENDLIDAYLDEGVYP